MRAVVRCLCCVLAVAACAKGSGPGGDDPDGPPGAADGPPLIIPDAPPTVDGPPAADATVDAIPPDAACSIQQQQMFVNPTFDSGAVGWVQFPWDAGYPLITTDLPGGGVAPYSSPYIVWMGGFYSATDRMYQEYAVPPTTSAIELRGYRWIASEETSGTYDFAYVEVRSTSDALLQTLTTWSNANENTGWTFFVQTIPASFAGQTIRLQLRTTTDFSLNTNFLFENVELFVTACL
jgi:hypothetical protein